jgi:hypothetical protein
MIASFLPLSNQCHFKVQESIRYSSIVLTQKKVFWPSIYLLRENHQSLLLMTSSHTTKDLLPSLQSKLRMETSGELLSRRRLLK